MHEDNVTPHLNPNVKRAYPVHDNGETRETKINLQPVDQYPFFFSEDTGNDSSSIGDDQNRSLTPTNEVVEKT